MKTGAKVAVVGGVLGGFGLLIWASTRTSAAPAPPGTPPVTHPEFAVGDEIQEIAGLPVDPYWDMSITKYTAGPAPHYGSYNLKILTGPQAGYSTIWWVSDVDGYYQKVA